MHLPRLLLCLLALALLAPGVARADEEQPYRIVESPLRSGPGRQFGPVVSGRWVVWREEEAGATNGQRLFGRDLQTGQDFTIASGGGGFLWIDVGGDVLATIEITNWGGYGVFTYHLPDGRKSTVAPIPDPSPPGTAPLIRGSVRTDGRTVVWTDQLSGRTTEVRAHDLATGRTATVASFAGGIANPVVRGSLVVWRDNRNSSPTDPEQDLYTYDLAAGRELRITPRPERIAGTAIAGGRVVWAAVRDGAPRLLAYDLGSRQESVLATLRDLTYDVTIDADGDLVVWSGTGDLDVDVFGYDLARRQPFVVSRAIGAQVTPRLSGRTVVWEDQRNRRTAARYDQESDVYAARLEPGPAAPPPAPGMPSAVDARIEIVWPHEGDGREAPVERAPLVNVEVYLFRRGTFDPVPCAFPNAVRLRWARNVALASSGLLVPTHHGDPGLGLPADGLLGRRTTRSVGGRDLPLWVFDDVPVAPGVDPAMGGARVTTYFLAEVEGVDYRTNVWAHGSDPRTFLPERTGVPPALGRPAGIPPTAPLDAFFDVVWPHDTQGRERPVTEAGLVNVAAGVQWHGGPSMPADFAHPVRLLRALNSGLLEPVKAADRVGVGRSGAVVWPRWEFDDVDVSAAWNPANKYYFAVQVDGAPTHTAVWSHGADARTYFPERDAPARSGPGC